MRLERQGIAVEIPTGWEAEIFSVAPAADTPAERSGRAGPPILHLANFPLPPERGGFGFEAIVGMASTDMFVALVDYGPGSGDKALFATEGLPLIEAHHFTRHAVVPPTSGAAAAQYFFHVGDRGFSLYAVVGSHRLRAAFVDAMRTVVSAIEVT